MTDHQRIHPVVDVEAPPTRPLVPRGSLTTEKDSSVQPQPPFIRTIPVQPPLPFSRANPVQPPLPFCRIPVVGPAKPHKKRSCCCKCFCWTISLIILLLIIIGAIVGIIYLMFQPKLPNYSVNNLQISDLRLNVDFSLYARFTVKITAENPNKKIGIYYEKGSQLSVWYKNTNLCHGQLPKFYQGHQNKTILDVALTGQSQYGRTLMSALQEEQQTGRIPLDLKINVPVRIELGNLKLPKVRILGDCNLIVDSLSTDNLVSIKASTCKFRLKL